MITKYSHIIPECYVDTNLVQVLMQIKGVNHQFSCGQVTNTMQKYYADSFSIGIIDNDKNQSTYSTESEVIAVSNELILCHHPNSQHYLIKIKNIMETFILNSAVALGLTFDQLGVPGGLEELTKITKDKDSINNPRLKSILKAVSAAPEMQLFVRILNYLNDKRYNSNEFDMKAIFAEYGF